MKTQLGLSELQTSNKQSGGLFVAQQGRVRSPERTGRGCAASRDLPLTRRCAIGCGIWPMSGAGSATCACSSFSDVRGSRRGSTDLPALSRKRDQPSISGKRAARPSAQEPRSCAGHGLMRADHPISCTTSSPAGGGSGSSTWSMTSRGNASRPSRTDRFRAAAWLVNEIP